MKNITKAQENLNKILVAKRIIEKESKRKGKLAERMVAKAQKRIEEAQNNKVGFFFVIGKTYPHREELKSLGFTYCGQDKVWYSSEEKEINIEGLLIIEA